MNSMTEVFQEISPADFFYRNRDIAGFTNPARAIYTTVRELIENSLDGCETESIPPDIYIRISPISETAETANVYEIRVEDNGAGIPGDVIPSAFGQILYGSKYKLRQTRGTFGLGGKMAILYGQITTHSKTIVTSGLRKSNIHEYHLMMDIQNNRPIILQKRSLPNQRWRGTILQFQTEADYTRAMPKILDYLKQTAIVTPYSNVIFVDPRGRLYKFNRVTSKMPTPPQETKPHPHGVDVETIKRLIAITGTRSIKEFMKEHFQRVGETTAKTFLEYVGVDPKKNPKKLLPEEIVKIAKGMTVYNGFLPPQADCLSPIGEELLETGIRKELNPEFITVVQRPAAAYSGFPFIIEVGIAYGGDIPANNKVRLYRFANKIPLLFDEASDVSWKVMNSLIDWRRYKVPSDAPLAVFVHLCSTKIPYKTVGKEFIADRPEVEREILNATREAARRLSLFLSKRQTLERQKRRLDVFAKYLPKIAKFSTILSEKGREPDIKVLLEGVMRYDDLDSN